MNWESRTLKDVMKSLPLHYYNSYNAWLMTGIFTESFHKHIIKEIVAHQCSCPEDLGGSCKGIDPLR